jgi:hypothetical protein
MVRTALEANVDAGNLPRQPDRAARPPDHRRAQRGGPGRRRFGHARAATRDEFIAALDGVLGALRAAVRS